MTRIHINPLKQSALYEQRSIMSDDKKKPLTKKGNKNVYCGNCGRPGHIYKQCREAIISLGIILYRKTSRGKEYLMIMRKDSLGYVELIRGNYPLDDLEYLKAIVEEMTQEEKHKILTQDFSSLWNGLWVEDNEKRAKYQKEYLKSMEKFKQLTEGLVVDNENVNLHDLVRQSSSEWIEPEWGFPKGRRNLKERDLQCAIREFEEETDISRQQIEIVKSVAPLEEEFTGSNKKRYKHIYYLAEAVDVILPRVNKEKKVQVIEIGDIRWCSLVEALRKIRSYNKEKRNVLRQADDILDTIDPPIDGLFDV